MKRYFVERRDIIGENADTTYGIMRIVDASASDLTIQRREDKEGPYVDSYS
jgi:hypothetical protein